MKYDELNAEAKEVAMCMYGDFLAKANDWWTPLMDELEDELVNDYGLRNVKVEFVFEDADGKAPQFTQNNTVLLHLSDESLSEKMFAAFEDIGTADEFVNDLASKFKVPAKFIPELKQALRSATLNGDVGITNPTGVKVNLKELYNAVRDHSTADELDAGDLREELNFIEYNVNYTLYERTRQFYSDLAEEWSQLYTEDGLREAEEANGWEFGADGEFA